MVARRSRKREPNEQVVPHVSNKRKPKGLDIIPEDAKSRTFDTVPSHVKVDLFNSIVKAAFPNFDNLMIASWNVISIYTACGSDFPELHRAIADLKSVLQDFHEAFGSRVDRAAPKYRYNFGGPARSGEGDKDNLDRSLRRKGNINNDRAQPGDEDKNEDHSALTACSANENVGGAAKRAHDSAVSEPVQEQNESSTPEDNCKQVENEDEPDMTVRPSSLQSTQQLEGVGGEKVEGDEDDDQIPHMDPRLSSRTNRHSGVYQHDSQHMAETHLGGSTLTSARSLPTRKCRPSAYKHVKRPREQNDKGDAAEREEILSQATSPELALRREEQPSSTGKASALPSLQRVTSTPIAKSSHVDETELLPEHEKYPSHFDEQHPPQPPSPPTPPPKKQKKKHDLSDYSPDTLHKKLQERKTHLINSFGSMNNVPASHMTPIHQLETAIKQRKRNDAQGRTSKERSASISRENARRPPGTPSGGMFGTYLGNSVLGVKKTAGIAPVAPMYPNAGRRDSRDDTPSSGQHGL